MRFATFNILHGRSITDGLVRPERLIAAVRALDVDVLGLQEVDRDQPRSGCLDLTAIAAEALGAVEHRFVPAVTGTPGEEFRAPVDGADDGLPQYGVALLSRWSVRRWLVQRLPAAPTRAPVSVAGRLLLLPDEPRVLLAAVVDAPGGELTVATTHLSFVPGWNVRQLRRCARALDRLATPAVLLGDLNVPARVARVVSGWRVPARRPTYPAIGPRIQLDHVLLDPRLDATVVAVETPAVGVSDHRPLVVQLER